MNLIKITDLTSQLGLTSRSLRYYEQVGLIKSVRLKFEKYRFYDEENVERLKQIIVLRKMQIPIRDIIRIYESEDMSVIVQTFVDRIIAIDGEINALSERRDSLLWCELSIHVGGFEPGGGTSGCHWFPWRD